MHAYVPTHTHTPRTPRTPLASIMRARSKGDIKSAKNHAIIYYMSGLLKLKSQSISPFTSNSYLEHTKLINILLPVTKKAEFQCKYNFSHLPFLLLFPEILGAQILQSHNCLYAQNIPPPIMENVSFESGSHHFHVLGLSILVSPPLLHFPLSTRSFLC